MNTHDKIELPAEFRSGNGVSVERATITRARMEEILVNAIEADRQRRGEPVAWIRKNGFRFTAEIEPQDDSEVPLYAAPQPTEPVKILGRDPTTVIMDEVNPVKVPSFVELANLAIEYGIMAGPILQGSRHAQLNESERLDAFAHTLLARYGSGQPAASVTPVPTTKEEYIALLEQRWLGYPLKGN